MIVCDICPDRTPAAVRYTVEVIDPEVPDDESSLETRAVMSMLGLLQPGRVGIRTAVTLCERHARMMKTDPEVIRTMIDDVAGSPDEPPPPDL